MKKLSIYLLISLLGFTAAFAQVDRSTYPAPGPAPQINIGDPETFTLPNGLRVFVVENHKLPRVTYSLILDRDPIL
ncbi:MAG TPA: insulinase family protein, partial [Sphingobacteriaceae bacterium]|nr:insulinase family protein [Sphingobacteriaceae bacterium]